MVDLLGRYSNLENLPESSRCVLIKPLSVAIDESRAFEQIQTRRRKQYQRRLSPAEVEQLVTAYQSGQSTYRLATLFQIRRETVVRNLQRAGVTLREARKLSREQAAEIRSRHTLGASVAEMSQWFDVSQDTIRRELRRQT